MRNKFKRLSCVLLAMLCMTSFSINEFLRKRHEAREREKAEAMKKAREKETMNNGKKTGNR